MNSVRVNRAYSTNLSLNLFNEISLLLEHVYNITLTYKVDLKRVEEVVRIEEFHRYDKSLINKTSQDARLFTVENNTIFPKKLYQYAYDENIDTYENRFILFLLMSLENDLKTGLNLLQKEKIPFLKSGISYGEYGTYSLLNRYINNEDKLLKEENLYKEKLEIYLRKISNLLKVDFFRYIKKVNFDEVYGTNILLNDKDYSFLYFYYKKNKENSELIKNQIYLDLFNLLEKENKENIIFRRSNYLSFLKDNFVFSFKKEGKIYLSLLNKDINLLKEYVLDLKISLFSKSLILTFEDEDYKVFIKSLEDLKEVIYSLKVLLRAKENVCPLCKKDNESDVCHSCNAKYALIKKNEGTFARIFNIFAVNLEGDEYEI